MSERMAKDVCAQVSESLVGLVPQLDDHLCPVCFNITWRPVRLPCGHVVCSGCVVLMQDREDKKCPVCRSKVIMQVTEGMCHLSATSRPPCSLSLLDLACRYDLRALRSCLFETSANLTSDDIDKTHLKFLKTYFPEETKARRVELETIDGQVRFGVLYTHPSERENKCTVM